LTVVFISQPICHALNQLVVYPNAADNSLGPKTR
jgi:hypothetical protein